MIEQIRIENFKSLVDVTLPLSRFSCLIGMNGAGKSTVLQALDFISHVMRGDVDRWVNSRGWKPADLRSHQLKELNITVNVVWRVSEQSTLTWTGVFNPSKMRCTRDWTVLQESSPSGVASTKLTLLDGKRFYIGGRGWQELNFKYEGSLLSALLDEDLPAPVIGLRNAVQQIHSLELLSPQLLRKRSRPVKGEEGEELDIGPGGERLSVFLGKLTGETRNTLVTLLKRFYPQIEGFKVGNVQAGWKKLTVTERFGTHLQDTEATHLSDGMLRILAVLAQAGANRSLILLDEIENGINQEIVEALVDTLVASPQQMLVTTHSPLILNYLPDDVARAAVQFIYKTPDGASRIRPFFQSPRINDKLRTMGPGDAFVDTDLRSLTTECMKMDRDEDLFVASDT
jgi:predicted ATPase